MTADYQGLVTKWREEARANIPEVYTCRGLEHKYLKLDNHDAGVNACADELAEVIARNAQPSPDEGAGWQVVVELEQLKARWWAGISGDGELSTTLTELADKLRKFLLARPVPPSPTTSFLCAARHSDTGANDPQDCDWPFCGCDQYADKVIEAIKESGFTLQARLALAPVSDSDEGKEK